MNAKSHQRSPHRTGVEGWGSRHPQNDVLLTETGQVLASEIDINAFEPPRYLRIKHGINGRPAALEIHIFIRTGAAVQGRRKVKDPAAQAGFVLQVQYTLKAGGKRLLHKAFSREIYPRVCIPGRQVDGKPLKR